MAGIVVVHVYKNIRPPLSGSGDYVLPVTQIGLSIIAYIREVVLYFLPVAQEPDVLKRTGLHRQAGHPGMINQTQRPIVPTE